MQNFYLIIETFLFGFNLMHTTCFFPEGLDLNLNFAQRFTFISMHGYRQLNYCFVVFCFVICLKLLTNKYSIVFETTIEKK